MSGVLGTPPLAKTFGVALREGGLVKMEVARRQVTVEFLIADF